MRYVLLLLCLATVVSWRSPAEDRGGWKPYSPPCVERESVFAFAEKPRVRLVGEDRYEITFAVQAYCDATVAVVDEKGFVVRHLGAGVLGCNAPPPFQKEARKQTVFWDGKDDLGEYAREPAKLRARVMLGLKPEFDKLLGNPSPYNLPGHAAGLAASPEGVFIFVRGGRGPPGERFAIRKFDHDGAYVQTIWPPPANLPREKLGGMWWVEYEPGRWSLQGADANPNYWGRSLWFGKEMEWAGPLLLRPAILGSRILFSCNGDVTGVRGSSGKPRLRWIHTDGSTDAKGLDGRSYFSAQASFMPRLAVSPDGRFVYMAGLESNSKQSAGQPVVLRFQTEGEEEAKVFVGKLDTPGREERLLNQPRDVACDAAGRVYVADQLNSRVQVFAEDGSLAKSVAVGSPYAVQVHPKSGALYVLHAVQVKGQGTARLTKFDAFPGFAEAFHQDGVGGDAFVLDGWCARPRLWVGQSGGKEGTANMAVWEETERGFKLFLDFNARARTEGGANHAGAWSGDNHGQKIVCDPLNERVYLGHAAFDLRSGRFLGNLDLGRRPGAHFAFDKRGYLHTEYAYSHVARAALDRETGKEVPYDYGEGKDGWLGAIPLHRVGRHPYGLGVNMRGDLAVVMGIEKIPKLETEEVLNSGRQARVGPLGLTGGTYNGTTEFFRALAEDEKRGVILPSVPRRPGYPLGYGSIWTWERSGEVRDRMAVVAGQRINGVQLDEDGCLYFSNARLRLLDGQPFLQDRAVRQGTGQKTTLFTGTYMKTRGPRARFICKDAPLPMDAWPSRPPDLGGPWVYADVNPGNSIGVWVEEAAWFYAGASPMKPADCSCYQLRAHLDWFKRSYVPELYRHSIGVLDTNGNLILHIGQYGNFDSAAGPGSKISPGGDGIASTFVRFVSGTDNYLCFEDWGERLTVLKLNYHAEAWAPIPSP